MRTKVLTSIVNTVNEGQAQKLKRHDCWTVTLDGWTGISSNRVYAVMLLDLKEQHYLGNLEI